MPCLPLPLHRTSLSPRPLQKNDNPSLAPTLPKPHYPSPRTKLASLVKGRWIDGKAQALILLLSVCDTSAFFIHQIFLPSRRRDCLPFHRTSLSPRPLQKNDNPSLAPTLPKPHYPSPRTKLASLVKGRWIDGKTQTVALLRFTCDMPTLFMLQTLLPSRRRDCHSITPSKTALSHLLFVLQSSVCAYTVLHLNYHISLFVGRGSVCACMVLHPCKT